MEFAVGDKVKLSQEALEGCLPSFREKYKDSIGRITACGPTGIDRAFGGPVVDVEWDDGEIFPFLPSWALEVIPL
jgi:hypothetical protein